MTLIIATADANLVKGTVVEGAGITGTVRINAVTGTAVTLDTAITIADGITLTMSPPGGAITGATAGTAASLTTPANKVNGRFYICDTSGKAEPNAAVPWALATTPNEWAVGDWVIYISNGAAADEWQKIDQSNEIFGSGAANKIAKWTASNTLGTGLIEDDGTTVTIGANGNLTVLGDTILGDNAAADTITLNGPTTFESTGRFKKGLALGTATDGSEYGDGTKVLTSSGASGTAPTWTTPTTGTVTTVSASTAGDALDVAVTNPTTTPAIALTWAGAASQYVNGVGNLITFPTVDNYVSWTADSDEGTDITVTSGFNLKFTGAVTSGGAGIATDSAVSANEMTIGLINAGGTPSATSFYRGDGQWAVPVGTKTETLAEVLSNGNTTGGTDIAVSAGDDITFTDTSKALFGDSNDLQIFHNPIVPVSIIEATGPLFISSDTNVAINKTSPAEPMAKFIVDGAVELFYDNVKKFETTTTGTTTTGVSYISGSGLNINSDTVDSLITLNRTTGIWSIDNDSSYHLNFKATSLGTTNLTLKSTGEVIIPDYGSGNNTGTPTYNLEVDASGNIIETTPSGGIPSGGSVSAKGGTFMFNEDITGNTGGNVLFSVRRPATGALALRLMLTSGDAVAESRTKIFDVCKSFGSATVFNKTIDSGPNTNTPANDFTIGFTPPTIGIAPTLSASGQKVISGLPGGSYVVGMGIVCNVSGRVPAGAVVTEAVSGVNQITIDQNLTGEINSSMSITTTSNDLIVCYATGTPATQDISVTLDLGYDNNTTATVSRKQ